MAPLEPIYDLTGTVIKRVSDARERLQWCPMNEVAWRTIATRLREGAEAADKLADMVKNGEVK